jgi:hypothetical protein
MKIPAHDLRRLPQVTLAAVYATFAATATNAQWFLG